MLTTTCIVAIHSPGRVTEAWRKRLWLLHPMLVVLRKENQEKRKKVHHLFLVLRMGKLEREEEKEYIVSSFKKGKIRDNKRSIFNKGESEKRREEKVHH